MKPQELSSINTHLIASGSKKSLKGVLKKVRAKIVVYKAMTSLSSSLKYTGCRKYYVGYEEGARFARKMPVYIYIYIYMIFFAAFIFRVTP